MAVQLTLRRMIWAPFQLVTWGFKFYFSHTVLVILALVPSVIRGYQMYTGHTPESLESILWVMRIALFAAIARIGWKERDRINWKQITVPAALELIVTALWQYAWFLYAIIPGIKLVTEWIGSEELMGVIVRLLHVSAIDVQALAKSVLFVLKNMFVIPMYVMFLLRMIRVI